ncbi:Glyoxylase, beta-lactamase superfamily II [Duganella sp. CF402]|uniref:MBL fold metallo-hydrolase n=1 Tax=unclassified Duganella TaxID=2636909 RepID=UPI0008B8752E|nr:MULTISPECIES: MBL fold metallo-hydrolase [unclassified Duganella]RZT09336.1 glyoxylase-like metal-dependent hydrolase (beta-lactamase superfamily II) [Duganella sp. BK701]SEL61258.1 Glyoxylase, beta-lactamase superfamily II [Duganella sp. CF402]
MFKPALLSAALAASVAAQAAPLKLDVFNPGEAAIFPVASVIVSGAKDAVLIDAQFSRGEAIKLVDKIKATGKHLTTIYISHDDPDFYFGLDVIHAAFPDAKIVATPAVIAGIERKKAAKVAYWGPILKDNAPREVIVPQPLQGDNITLEGQTLQIKDAPRGYVWIPSIKAVVGGVVLFNDLHVWTADTQTPESRRQWLATLDGIAALKPTTVVPGHFAPGAPLTAAAIGYTRNYLVSFENETAKAADSAALSARMKALYPSAGLPAALDTSAKVAKGEMKW